MKETRREGEEGESGREGTVEGVRKRERERWIDRERERETIYGIKGPEQRGMKRDV